MSYVIAKIYDAVLARTERLCLGEWRRQLLRELSGAVLEIGAGTGRNLGQYGQGVEQLTLAEPDPHMRLQLARHLRGTRFEKRVALSNASAEALPYAEGAFDAVVCTLVLCSVADPERCLSEAFRVLRPGGRLLLVEHIRAPEGTRRRQWQQRLDPLWSRVANGCHLDRDPRSTLERTGFYTHASVIDELRGAPGFLRTTLRGTWQKPE